MLLEEATSTLSLLVEFTSVSTCPFPFDVAVTSFTHSSTLTASSCTVHSDVAVTTFLMIFVDILNIASVDKTVW